jgi:hypothetical protein
MKLFLLPAILLTSLVSSAQYYYKDIIGTKESSELLSSYRNNNVRHVVVNSFDGENSRIDNLQVQQEFNPSLLALTTITKSEANDQSFLKTFIDASGKVVKTIDSSALVVNQTLYNYSPEGLLTSLVITSIDSSRKSNETEEHIWQYKDKKISRMIRVKNKVDTTYVDFKLDENGNVIEEQESHHGVKSFAVLYYYDNNNRLTDIVRYNPKAKRLLPEYMFEYSPSNQVIQRITIPANSSEYIIWRYQFNDKGLKTKEAIYNKQKELTGKVEYQYSF